MNTDTDRRSSGRIYLIVTIVYFAFMGAVFFGGPSFVKLISPKVLSSQFSGGYISNGREYHQKTVPNKAIIQEGDKYYIFIMRNKKTFWIDGSYSIKFEVSVVDSDEKKTAITTVENINSMDYIIYESNKPLKDGGRVFKDE